MIWDAIGVERAAVAIGADLLHIPHFAAPLRPRLPLVVTIHDAIPLALPAYRATRAARLRLALAQRTVRAAALVLCPSHHAAGEVGRLIGIDAERIRVTPEAASPEHRPAAPGDDTPARIARSLAIPGRYVFNVGGLDARKNLPVLLDAFARALPRLTEPAWLVIAGAAHTGNPNVYPPLAPVIERFGLADRVILPGFVTSAQKIALYQGAALYATPSLYEGFGLTPLEAMACGAPTIAANRTSLPEVVGDGGLLVEPEPAAFAAAMTDVLNDPGRVADLRRRALTRATAFNWRQTASLTLAAYHEVLDRGATRRRRHG
jgi:glycosyltransferase involved in cell wall biosynthesis